MNKRIELVLKITKMSDEEFQNAISLLKKYLKDHANQNSMLISADRMLQNKSG
jgi:hypothetical protein